MIDQPAEPEKVVRVLNSLLRSEISATETYTQAIPRVQTDAGVLREIAREHGQAVSDLRAAIQSVGGTPEESSGVFPALPAKAVFGPAQVFAEAAMLTALREVEERGLGDYRDAVRRLNGASLRWISENLIPAQMKHISDLEELLSRL
jgi:rubrerythrin